MNEIISEAIKLGLWRRFDIEFAHMLVHPSQHSVVLAIITLNFYINRGHTCLPLSMLVPDCLFCGLHVFLAIKICKKFGDFSIENWEKLLFNSGIVSDGSFLAPLVLEEHQLYLYRMWKSECLVAQFFFSRSQQLSNISKKKINKISYLLNYFFPIDNILNSNVEGGIKENIDWQKISIAMSLIRRVIVISGGPGTGKTSVIAKLLAILLLLSRSFLTIIMAAPTGKSADCLSTAIRSMFEMLNFFDIFHRKNDFSIKVMTLHKLLGIYFNKQNIKRAQYNFLLLDYLIIDECSMISLSMMAKIIQFLSSKTTIIFLGDHKQLPSIDPGAIFSDICYFSGRGYTYFFSKQLQELTSYIVPISKYTKYSIIDNLCVLKKNYRFSSTSEIAKLASAISSKDQCNVLHLLKSTNNKSLNYNVLKKNEDYDGMINSCVLGYLEYFKNIPCNINTYKDLEVILKIFNRYRVLCVIRDGPYGISELNISIENILSSRGLIDIRDKDKNYVGRPILITINSESLLLFNGEIGIILPDNHIKNSPLFAYFLSPDKNIKKISLHNLPKYETAFVMTVHKSQGSEFNYVTLIFPDKVMPILTNELFYTGVTRASKHLSIYANDHIICYSVNNSYNRYTGLIDRIKRLMV